MINFIHSPQTRPISGHWRGKQFRTVYTWHLQDRGIWSKGQVKGVYHQCTDSRPSLQAQGRVSLQGKHWQISQGCVTSRCQCASAQQSGGEWRCHCPCQVTIPYSKHSQIVSDGPVQEEGFGQGYSQQSRAVRGRGTCSMKITFFITE